MSEGALWGEGGDALGPSHRANLQSSAGGATLFPSPLGNRVLLPHPFHRCLQVSQAVEAGADGLGDSGICAVPVAGPGVSPGSGNSLQFWYFFLGTLGGAVVSELLTLLLGFLI